MDKVDGQAGCHGIASEGHLSESKAALATMGLVQTMGEGGRARERHGSHDPARLETFLEWSKIRALGEPANCQAGAGGLVEVVEGVVEREGFGGGRGGRGGPKLWKPRRLPRRRSSGRTTHDHQRIHSHPRTRTLDRRRDDSREAEALCQPGVNRIGTLSSRNTAPLRWPSRNCTRPRPRM